MHIPAFKLTVNQSQIKSSKSSLLIPAADLDYFYHQCNRHGSRVAYFAFMLNQYIPRIHDWKSKINQVRNPDWKTVYQESGNQLIKKNLLPDAHNWESFRHVACACGVSMCFLFVFLMLLEKSNFFQPSPKLPRCRKLFGWISAIFSFFIRRKWVRGSFLRRDLQSNKKKLHRIIRIN